MTQEPTTQSPELVVVSSRDGTPISYLRSGSGPPVLLVHGALMDAKGWAQVTSILDSHFTVCALDRRGRHASGNTLPYDPQREVEDLFAVTETLAQPVDVAAHSSGATLVLKALEAGLPARRVVLYEPPLSTPQTVGRWTNIVEELEVLVTAGDLEAATEYFLIKGPGNTPEAVARMKAGPYWKDIVPLAIAATHDPRVVASYTPKPEALVKVTQPCLVLQGSATDAWLQACASQLAEMLPNARLHRLEGQGHFAMYTGAPLLAEEIRHFLTE